MDDKTKISPRFITGNIGQITAFEETGGTPSHPKVDMEYKGGDRFSGPNRLL